VFDGFSRECFPRLASFVTLSSYGEDFHLPTAFAPGSISNGFGEYISGLGLKQLRIAETENMRMSPTSSTRKEHPYPAKTASWCRRPRC